MMKERRDLKAIQSKEKIFFYGIGNQFKECLRLFDEAKNIYLFDKNKTGQYKNKYQIHSPEKLLQLYTPNTAVIISSIKNQYEIARELVRQYHISPDDLFSYTSKDYEEKIYRTDLISKQRESIERAYHSLEDQASKDYWEHSLRMRIERQPLYLQPNPHSLAVGEYQDILKPEKGDVIVDCGAYIGDTAEMYINRLQGDCQIYALEPLKENYAELQNTIQMNAWKNVKAYHCAVGKKDCIEELHYEKEDFRMGISLGKSSGSCTEQIEVHTLDHLFLHLPHIDYLKMDIEGQEMDALYGASEILKKKAPKLMISGYHKMSDLWEVPLLIKKINPAYKIYLGHAPGVSMELEFYCKV